MEILHHKEREGKQMKLYDCRVKIHEKTADHMEELDAMLTDYGVDHAFILPTTAEMEDDERLSAYVCYMEEDGVTFNLVSLLFAKTVVGMKDEKIISVMRQWSDSVGL